MVWRGNLTSRALTALCAMVGGVGAMGELLAAPVPLPLRNFLSRSRPAMICFISSGVRGVVDMITSRATMKFIELSWHFTKKIKGQVAKFKGVLSAP